MMAWLATAPPPQLFSMRKRVIKLRLVSMSVRLRSELDRAASPPTREPTRSRSAASSDVDAYLSTVSAMLQSFGLPYYDVRDLFAASSWRTRRCVDGDDASGTAV